MGYNSHLGIYIYIYKYRATNLQTSRVGRFGVRYTPQPPKKYKNKAKMTQVKTSPARHAHIHAFLSSKTHTPLTTLDTTRKLIYAFITGMSESSRGTDTGNQCARPIYV